VVRCALRIAPSVFVVTMTALLLCPATPQVARADELEEGVEYQCSASGVSIEHFSKDGGGMEEPFPAFETDTNAVWNIDRIDRQRLPIIKQCKVGAHQITTVIFERCAVETGIAISVAIYSDTQLTIDAKKKVVANHDPIVNAAIFGFLCWSMKDPAFSAISISDAGHGGKNLAVEMH
jgi:hypothetical protein